MTQRERIVRVEGGVPGLKPNRPLAVSMMPLENRRDIILHLASEAERLGFDGVFLTETWAHDTTVLLAAAAERTRRIQLGSGVLSIWGRSAGTLAMAAATLNELSGGRFVLGLGASTAQLTEGLHDVPFAAPIKQVRRVLTQVRALLRGDRIPLAAVAEARPLRLNLQPAPDVPIYLAGLADETIRLAGELADGWMPFLYPLSCLKEAAGLIAEGARRAAEPRDPARVCPFIPAAVADDPAEARRTAEWFIVFYLTSMGPLYPRTLERLGFASEVAAVRRANSERGSAVVPPEAEALLDELIVYGTPEAARERLARWYEAGAEVPILLLPPRLATEQIGFALSALRDHSGARN